jgi:hypothetical protein
MQPIIGLLLRLMQAFFLPKKIPICLHRILIHQLAFVLNAVHRDRIARQNFAHHVDIHSIVIKYFPFFSKYLE